MWRISDMWQILDFLLYSLFYVSKCHESLRKSFIIEKLISCEGKKGKKGLFLIVLICENLKTYDM